MAENYNIPSQGGNYFFRRNRTDDIEDERTEGIENIRRINEHLQEVTLEREEVISYGFENSGILLEDFTPWITTLKLEKIITCIHKIQYSAMVLFEITAKSIEDKRHISLTLESAHIVINGARLRKFENRELKDIRRTPYTKIWIYEAPYELENKHIYQKLYTYGIPKEQTISRHKIPGMDIYNGVRSINFTSITKPIPTTLYIRGNRIKIKYSGQDRTPICGICKTKGHYRTDCPRNRETEEEKDDPTGPYMTGMEQEVQEDPTSVESDTDSNISNITTNQTSAWKGDPMKDLAWDTTDLDNPNPGELEKNGTCLSQWTEAVATQSGRKKREERNKKKNTEASTINITLKNRYGSLQEDSTEEKTPTNKRRRKEDSRTKDESQTIELNFSADTETDPFENEEEEDTPKGSPDIK